MPKNLGVDLTTIPTTIASGDSGHADKHNAANAAIRAIVAAGIPSVLADLTDGAALKTSVDANTTAIGTKVDAPYVAQEIAKIPASGGSSSNAVYADVDGTYPLRATVTASTSTPVLWVGPTPPSTATGYALTIDRWDNTKGLVA